VFQPFQPNSCFQPRLHREEELLRDDRLMETGEEPVLVPEMDLSHVERIPEEQGEPGDRDPATSSVPEPKIEKDRGKTLKCVLTTCVPGEGKPDERPPFRVDLLRLAGTAIQVPDRRLVRVEPLFQPFLNATLGLLAEVPDVVSGDHRLDICGESTAPGRHVDPFAGEVDGDAPIDELSQVRPVLQVPGRAVYLMDDQSVRFAVSQFLEHLPKDRPPALGRRFPLLEPADDDEAPPGSEPRDLLPLK
jgi:hypothetical protein